MLFDVGMRWGVEAVVACIALIGSGGAGGGTGGSGGGTLGGGSGAPTDCSVDTTQNSGSAECGRSGICGSGECCFTEFVIPPHDDLVAGDKRIIHEESFQGEVRYRNCDPPFSLFGLSFGRWTCELESRSPFGRYYNFTLAPCPVIEKPKAESPPPSPSGDGKTE